MLCRHIGSPQAGQHSLPVTQQGCDGSPAFHPERAGGVKAARRLPLKQMQALGAGLGEGRGTWLDRKEDSSAADLQRGWEGEMVMGAETL